LKLAIIPSMASTNSSFFGKSLSLLSFSSYLSFGSVGGPSKSLSFIPSTKALIQSLSSLHLSLIASTIASFLA